MTTNSTESHFSCNFKMVRDRNEFQFTVRQDTHTDLLANIEVLIAQAKAMGWSFMASNLPTSVTMQQAQTNANAAAPALPQPIASQPTGNAPLTPAGSIIPKELEAYVVGSYMDKQSGAPKECLHLYSARRPYKEYTLYPEQFHILPFTPDLSGGAWPGSAPSKEQAVARGVYKMQPFTIMVTPVVSPSGEVVVERGYTKYKPFIGPKGAPQPVGMSPVAWPERMTHNGADLQQDALSWVMQETTDALHQWKLDDREWEFLSDFREEVIAHILTTEGEPTEKQWKLWSEWAREACAANEGATTLLDNGKALTPAALLHYVLTDFDTNDRTEAFGGVVVKVLKMTQKTRGTNDSPNPDYIPSVAHALATTLKHIWNAGIGLEAEEAF